MVAPSPSWDDDWGEMRISLLPVDGTRAAQSNWTPIRAWRSTVILVSIAAIMAFLLPQILVEHPAQAASGVTDWSIQPTPPAGANAGEGLFAVSCASSSFCEAVGQYHDFSNEYEFAADQWNGTEWVSQTLPQVGVQVPGLSVSHACPPPSVQPWASLRTQLETKVRLLESGMALSGHYNNYYSLQLLARGSC
jgi:hypothetical protein